MKRLILFLVRRKLHLRKYEPFQFENQKSEKDVYFFDSEKIWKYDYIHNKIIQSRVSINWLLDNQCHVITL